MIMMPYGWTLAIAGALRSGGLLAPHKVGHQREAVDKSRGRQLT